MLAGRESGLLLLLQVNVGYNRYGMRRFAATAIIDNPASGFIQHNTLLIKYTQEVVLWDGGVLKKPSAQPTPAADGGAQVCSPSRLTGALGYPMLEGW